MSNLLERLNLSQREAVTHETGPLLIIAGPGSGKTRTVVHSIAYAIENGVMPEQILAFSFTVKASEELRNRVKEKEIVGEEKGNLVNISTFHSFCRWVLREDIDKLGRGYARNFKALEENDQKRIVKDLTRINEQRVRAEIEHIQSYKFPNPDEVLNFIKKCKAREISPSDAGPHTHEFHRSEDYIKIYESYEQFLKTKGWIDYESQQLFTDELFRNVPEVKTKWQDKFELIFVDEYQDTDPIQYRIVKALAESHQNLRVVGDDDQGIYGWRGADIQNILNFEKDYLNAKVISLGQNYRSTQQIVEASRALAEFNPDRREKELFTRNFEGEKIKHLHSANHEREAAAIAGFIQRARQAGRSPSDFAVLYRTNRQAEAFTEAFNELEIPCHVGDINAVSLMTIHKAKGLEFPNVFVAGVCTGLLPLHNSNEKDWDEELRLLYVAMTRAQNWLCLSSYEEDMQYSRGKSPFLDYIPTTLLESVDRLGNIPPSPKKMIVPAGDEEITEYVDPLPIGTQTVIGIDPGNIGANTTNVGWSITQKSSHGYSVLDFGTERPTGTSKDKLEQIEQKIKSLIQFSSNRPHAIAVEKLEIATEEARKEWFLYVAACVATVRSIANKEGIECRLYTPQHVKYAATDNRKASKRDVQRAVKRMCNLQQIPEPHHSADAIATSLCYLRSYLNSSRFEGNKQKREHYEAGCDYLNNRQYEAAVDEFKKTINIDPIYTEAHCGLGRAYLEQNKLVEAEESANEALRLDTNNQPAHKLLNDIKQAHYDCGNSHLEQGNLKAAPDMILVPAGTFQMGSSDREAPSNEKPMHTVYLDDFYMDKYPVTNAQYKKFIDANPQWRKERIPRKYHNGGYLKHWNGNNYPDGKGSHPVVYISWHAALAYAKWAGKRLPTEAEWEKAARGGAIGWKYPWGDSIDFNKANYNMNTGGTTLVGNYFPNSYGLYDIVGNVWEWCFDKYYEDFYVRSTCHNPFAGGTLKHIITHFKNVKTSRVLRGGSWSTEPKDMHNTTRTWGNPNYSLPDLGFRCLKPVVP